MKRLVFVWVLSIGILGGVTTASAQDSGPRVRFGFSFEGGGVVGAGGGGVGGLGLRIGVQANDVLAIYYQNRMSLGAFVGESQGEETAGGMLADFNTVMFELTLGDHFQIGAGPSLDFGSFAFCDEETCEGVAGTFFGLDTRVALVFGRGPGSRGGFAISAHVHPMFLGDVTAVTVTGGLGGEWY
ncbi:MAG: hypothetical protein AAGF12_39075 [Myxococcota bacterium]